MKPNQIHQGKYIAKVLDDLRWSQSTLAKKIHKHRSTVHHLLQRDRLDLELLEDISDALQIDLISEFYPDKKYLRKQEVQEEQAPYNVQRTATKITIGFEIDSSNPTEIPPKLIEELNQLLMKHRVVQ